MLSQPNSIPTSEEIAIANENARNNVNLLEAEAQRLERLIASQKRELISLDGTRADTKNQIDILEEKRIVFVQENVSLQKSKDLLVKDMENLTKIIETTKAEIAIRESELSDREANISSTEDMLQQAEIALRERATTLAISEEAIRSKKEILNQTLLNL